MGSSRNLKQIQKENKTIEETNKENSTREAIARKF